MSHRNCHTWINQVSCNGPINKHKHPFWSNHPKTRQWCVGVLLMISPILFVVFLGWNLCTKSTWSKIVNSIFLMSFLLEIPLFIKIEVQRGNKHASKIENNSPYVSMGILAIDIILIMWPSLHDLDVWVLIFELIVLISYIVYLFDYDKHLDNDEVKYNINDPYIPVRKNEFNKVKKGYYKNMAENSKKHVNNKGMTKMNHSWLYDFVKFIFKGTNTYRFKKELKDIERKKISNNMKEKLSYNKRVPNSDASESVHKQTKSSSASASKSSANSGVASNSSVTSSDSAPKSKNQEPSVNNTSISSSNNNTNSVVSSMNNNISVYTDSLISKAAHRLSEKASSQRHTRYFHPF